MNDVGMVCWRATLATEEYPGGREVILVANDITHMSGSFSPREDAVYRAAFDLSVAEGLPCVYISANSGARIGLDEAVKAAFREHRELACTHNTMRSTKHNTRTLGNRYRGAYPS